MSSITSVIAGNLLSLALVCVLRLTSSIVPADYVRAFEAALFVTQTFTAGWTAVLLGRHLVDHHERLHVILASAIVFLSIPVVAVMMLGAAGVLTLPSTVIVTAAVQIVLVAWTYGAATPALASRSLDIDETAQRLSRLERFTLATCTLAYAVLNVARTAAEKRQRVAPFHSRVSFARGRDIRPMSSGLCVSAPGIGACRRFYHSTRHCGKRDEPKE